jgi:hypothetical protein
MSLTKEEFQEIEKFTKAAPTLFTGFIMDETPQGRANAQSLASFLDGRSQQYTATNLTAAVIAMQHVLIWEKGQEPAAPSDKRDSKTLDSLKYTPTIHSDRANGIESSFARDIREGREKHVADNIRRERDAQRYKETHQTRVSPSGRTDYAESNRLNDEARRRHAEEDARESGKPAVGTQPQRIPLHATPQDLKNYDREQIREWMQRRKIAGLPI